SPRSGNNDVRWSRACDPMRLHPLCGPGSIHLGKSGEFLGKARDCLEAMNVGPTSLVHRDKTRRTQLATSAHTTTTLRMEMLPWPNIPGVGVSGSIENTSAPTCDIDATT